MKIVPVSVDELKVQGITIGRRDTYGTEQVEFDLTELIDTYGNGSAILMVKRKLDETAYPATTEQADGKLLWTVSEIDTAYKGKGECEIFWYVDGNLAKTVIYPISIMRDIGETTEEPPDPLPTWLDDLAALGAETLENARHAAESEAAAGQSKADAEAAAGRAEESERNAGESEESAERNAILAEFWSRMAQEAAAEDGWVYFYIDDEGVLHYVKTENAALSFYIDVMGVLHVTNA